VRLSPLLPAPNYGSVVPYTIFRSAFPKARNIEFLSELRIKSILYVLFILAIMSSSLLFLALTAA